MWSPWQHPQTQPKRPQSFHGLGSGGDFLGCPMKQPGPLPAQGLGGRRMGRPRSDTPQVMVGGNPRPGSPQSLGEPQEAMVTPKQGSPRVPPRAGVPVER